jgi:hypothetical protein
VPATLESLLIIFFIITPGFVCWQLTAARVSSAITSDVHTVIVSLIFSLIIQSIMFPWMVKLIPDFYLLKKDIDGVSQSGALVPNWSLFLWLLSALFFVPIVMAFLLSWIWKARWSQSVLGKFGLSNVQKTPQAWDWFFLTQKQGCWVVAELDDGVLVGGVYGQSSFASLTPHQHDLYIEDAYHIDEDHNFLDSIPQNVGVWINGDKVRKLHVYRVAEGSDYGRSAGN